MTQDCPKRERGKQCFRVGKKVYVIDVSPFSTPKRIAQDMNRRAGAEIFDVALEIIIVADPDSYISRGSEAEVRQILESLLVDHRPQL